MKVRTTLWIIAIIAVLLLACQVLLSTSITSYTSVDWGLLSRLPLTFWSGLSLLGALLYFGRKSQHETVIVSILLFFFLFVIPMLILENKAAWMSYPTVELLKLTIFIGWPYFICRHFTLGATKLAWLLLYIRLFIHNNRIINNHV